MKNMIVHPKNAFGFYFSGQTQFEPKTRKSWLDKTEHTVLSIVVAHLWAFLKSPMNRQLQYLAKACP
jgi:hypothetical protein